MFPHVWLDLLLNILKVVVVRDVALLRGQHVPEHPGVLQQDGVDVSLPEVGHGGDVLRTLLMMWGIDIFRSIITKVWREGSLFRLCENLVTVEVLHLVDQDPCVSRYELLLILLFSARCFGRSYARNAMHLIRPRH